MQVEADHFALIVLAASGALGGIGFAEVKMNNANVRSGPGGKTVMQPEAPSSVFVFEEKRQGGYLWGHVTTLRRKDAYEGYLR